MTMQERRRITARWFHGTILGVLFFLSSIVQGTSKSCQSVKELCYDDFARTNLDASRLRPAQWLIDLGI